MGAVGIVANNNNNNNGNNNTNAANVHYENIYESIEQFAGNAGVQVGLDFIYLVYF